MFTDDRLTKAVGILLFFYAVGFLIKVTQGESIPLFEIPELLVSEENNLLDKLIGTAGLLFGTTISLLTMPFEVILAVDFEGIPALTYFVKGICSIILLYVYFVILRALKELFNPLS